LGYRDPTYVVFDGDEDGWAYRFMRGWKANERIDFDFRDAHDLDTMTNRAKNEEYVKAMLRQRMEQSSAVLVLVGTKTKNLYRFVRWELDLALELDLPLIVVNLNDRRDRDEILCPAIVEDACAVHVPFKMKAIKYGLDNWPTEYRSLGAQAKRQGPRHYPTSLYARLGI